MLLHLQLPETVLIAYLSRRYRDTLYRGVVQDWTGGDTHIDVRRSGRFVLGEQEGKPSLSVPVDVQMDIRKNDPGFLHVFKQIGGLHQLSYSLRVTFVLDRFWGEEWQLDLKILAYFDWIEKPRIGSLLSFQLSSWMEPMIRKQLYRQAKVIAASLNRVLDLETSLPGIWHSIHQPRVIEPEWPVWLTLSAGDHMSRTVVRKAHGGLLMKFNSPAEAVLTPGSKPEVLYPDLPQTLVGGAEDEGQTELPFRASIPLSWLEARLSGYRMGPMTIRELSIRPQSDDLLAEAAIQIGGKIIGVNRKIRARLKFAVVPAPEYVHFDIRFMELPFPFSLGAGRWASRIRKAVTGWLSERISTYEKTLIKTFADLDLGTGWRLQARSLRIDLKEIEQGEADVLVRGLLRGTASLVLIELPDTTDS